MSNKRKKILIKEKYDIIKKIDEGIDGKSIINKYNLKSSSHLSKIIKSKSKIIYQYEKMNPKIANKASYCRLSDFPDVEEALVIWLRQKRDKKLNISSEMISEKAKQLAEAMGYENFKASNKYIEGLKRRQNIRFIKTRGESDSVPQEGVENWKTKLQEEIEGYEPKDVFNLDETALFY